MHKSRNKPAMLKMKEELRKKGHNLTFTSYLPLAAGQSKANTVELQNAVRKVGRLEKRKGREVIPVPAGEPLFLFHDAKGKTEPVKTFYDSGCSHAVFRAGIPGGQLRGQ